MISQELFPKIKELDKLEKEQEINNFKKDNEQIFWQKINEYSLVEIWDNQEDNIYNQSK